MPGEAPQKTQTTGLALSLASTCWERGEAPFTVVEGWVAFSVGVPVVGVLKFDSEGMADVVSKFQRKRKRESRVGKRRNEVKGLCTGASFPNQVDSRSASDEESHKLIHNSLTRWFASDRSIGVHER